MLSPANRRAVVWEGLGVTARRGEAKWSSGVASVWGYIITKMFSKIHLDVTTTTEEHDLIWIRTHNKLVARLAPYGVRIFSKQRVDEKIA